MNFFRRIITMALGVFAGALAYKLLNDYNETNLIEGEYAEIPLPTETPEPAAAPAEPFAYTAPVAADDVPNANPVTLGGAEKPVMQDGKLDPTRIASPEDFANWEESGCQG